MPGKASTRFGVQDFSRLAHRADFKKGRIQRPYFYLMEPSEGFLFEFLNISTSKHSPKEPFGKFVKSVRHLFNYQIDIRSGFPYHLR